MKRLIVLATGLLAALAVTVSPATAGQASAATSGVCSGWEAAGAAAFDSLGALTATGGSARTAGNVTKEPSLSATYKALPDSAKGKARAGFQASVPVWIHVISDGATGNIPQSVIDKQMSVMVGPAVGGALLAASPTGLWVVMASVLFCGGLATLALERGLPAGLRRVPRGARAQELVPLSVPAPEPEAAQAAG